MEYFNSDGTLMTLEQRGNLERGRRNKYLMLYVDSINAVRWNTMEAEQQLQLINYRQALLDIPQQLGFPTEIVWPEKPE